MSKSVILSASYSYVFEDDLSQLDWITDMIRLIIQDVHLMKLEKGFIDLFKTAFMNGALILTP